VTTDDNDAEGVLPFDQWFLPWAMEVRVLGAVLHFIRHGIFDVQMLNGKREYRRSKPFKHELLSHVVKIDEGLVKFFIRNDIDRQVYEAIGTAWESIEDTDGNCL
jgi:hypothetical protein